MTPTLAECSLSGPDTMPELIAPVGEVELENVLLMAVVGTIDGALDDGRPNDVGKEDKGREVLAGVFGSRLEVALGDWLGRVFIDGPEGSMIDALRDEVGPDGKDDGDRISDARGNPASLQASS